MQGPPPAPAGAPEPAAPEGIPRLALRKQSGPGINRAATDAAEAAAAATVAKEEAEAAEAAPKTRPCPKCKQPINISDIVCTQCGYGAPKKGRGGKFSVANAIKVILAIGLIAFAGYRFYKFFNKPKYQYVPPTEDYLEDSADPQDQLPDRAADYPVEGEE